MSEAESWNSLASIGEFQIHELSKDFRMVVDRPRPDLPSNIENQIEDYWEKAVEANPALFNGPVFSANFVTPCLITGHLTEFRRVVAQVRDPNLYSHLALRPVSVSGILLCGAACGARTLFQSVILGLRSAQSIFQPSIWQLPPAGSIDSSTVADSGEIDWQTQLAHELKEEIGVPWQAVEPAQSICMIEYPRVHSLQIGVPLLCSWDPGAIAKAHKIEGNAEYEALAAVTMSSLPETIKELGDRLSPASRIFLDGLLKGRFQV